jgi:translation initiation factor IF-2
LRVNELSKELGRTNKEVLAFLKEKGVDGITHSSNVTQEQAQMVRKHFGGAGTAGSTSDREMKEKDPEMKAEKVQTVKADEKPQQADEKPQQADEKPQQTQTAGAQTETTARSNVKQEEKPVSDMQEGQKGAEQAAAPEEPKKKKFTAVFRPQNAQQQSRRPRPQQAQNQSGTRFAQQPQQAQRPSEGKPAQARPVSQGDAAGSAPSAAPQVKPADAPITGQAAGKPAQNAPQGENSTSAQKVPTGTQASDAPGSAPKNAAAQNSSAQDTTAQTPAQDAEKTNKAPLLEGRTTVTKLGNIFANMKPKAPASSSAGNSGNNRNNNNRVNDRNGDRRNFDNRNGDRRNGQGGYQGQRPAAGGQGGYRNGQRVGDGQNAGRGDNQRGYIVNGQRQTGANQGQRPAAGGQRFSRDNRTARPGDNTGRRPFGGAQGGAGAAPAADNSYTKKNTGNQKQTRNSYKDKNDKRHRTEDGPVKNTGKVSKHPFIKPTAKPVEVVEEIKEIQVPDSITIRDLAERMKLQAAAIIKELFMKGEIVTVNTEITYEKAEEIALEHDILCTKEEKVNVIEELLKEGEEDESEMVERPPVVCVMGHVDHGKTSLLDKIRRTNVTSHEAGGITQAIGAYQVKINDRLITFLDTPGHEAFTAMRMRGAQSTDIAVLVVAADDGVMPQTIEAINHAKAADVDIVVAINKIDKPDANIDRVKQELSEQGIIPEDWGGSTPFCPVSAKTGEGIEDLLEMILLTADIDELKANPNRLARGLVIEAQLDKGRGPVATVLVQKGTLNVGDFIAAGACSGKVRAMINDKGQRVKIAKPSTPVEILGLDKVPEAGEVFVATETDKEAKDFAATFIAENKNKLLEETKAKMSLDDLFSQIQAGNVKELPIIVKADVQGSVEAIKTSLTKLSNDEVQARVIHGAVGAISESDVNLASASGAIIIGFNVKPDATAKATAEREKVEIKLYNVIYQAIDDVERAMKGMLAPVYEEKVIGHAVIRQIFKASEVGNIAGSYILDGQLQRDCKIRITREGEQVYEGSLASLKRFKDDVKEVKAGYECGLVFDGYNEIQVDDQIEGYIMVEVPRE